MQYFHFCKDILAAGLLMDKLNSTGTNTKPHMLVLEAYYMVTFFAHGIPYKMGGNNRCYDILSTCAKLPSQNEIL